MLFKFFLLESLLIYVLKFLLSVVLSRWDVYANSLIVLVAGDNNPLSKMVADERRSSSFAQNSLVLSLFICFLYFICIGYKYVLFLLSIWGRNSAPFWMNLFYNSFFFISIFNIQYIFTLAIDIYFLLYYRNKLNKKTHYKE